MAACALFSGGDGNNGGSGSSPLNTTTTTTSGGASNNSSNMSGTEEQHHTLHGMAAPQVPHCGVGERKMVRKRMASEMMELHHHHHANNNNNNPRFSRRSSNTNNMSSSLNCSLPSTEKAAPTTTTTLAAGTTSTTNSNYHHYNNNSNNTNINNNINNNSHSHSLGHSNAALSRDNVAAIQNYPTTTVTVTTNYSTMLLPPSSSASVPSTPNYTHFQGLVEGHSQEQQNNHPAVCGFSGLPLFPSQTQRNNNISGGAINNNNIVVDVVGSSPSMEETSAASNWIDGILKDLIHSSNSVSIPQLISNVREIIYPCNPNLAVVLEHRLRLLTESSSTPTPPSSSCGVVSERNKRNTDQVVVPPNVSSAKLMGRVDGIVPSLHFPDSSVLNHQNNIFPNWGVPSPINTLQHNQDSSNNNPSVSLVTLPSPQSTHQDQHQHQHQQEEDLSASAAAAAAATTSNSAAEIVLTRKKKEELREQKKKDEDGLHLLTLLLQCAEAVSAENLEDANKMLLEISQLSTPFGTSAQRVAAYFSEAISARLVSSCLGIYATLPNTPHSHKVASAFQVFNGISPFVKFSHFTANQAIQEAFDREERVHIIDLDIMQGLQWPGLFHILASRPGGPPYVRLTGLGNSMETLEATGKRLSDFASKLGLPFEFFPVADKVGNLDPERLNVTKTEAVAVHWLQHSLYDVTGSDTNTLWLLQR